VERLIGSVRRELLDQTFFWNDQDLARKLTSYKEYYNLHRTHSSLKGQTPVKVSDKTQDNIINLKNYHATALPGTISASYRRVSCGLPRIRQGQLKVFLPHKRQVICAAVLATLITMDQH